jgi:hypothetical protein
MMNAHTNNKICLSGIPQQINGGWPRSMMSGYFIFFKKMAILCKLMKMVTVYQTLLFRTI